MDDPLLALPYMGPNLYWRGNAIAILRHGYSKAGKITWTSFKYVLEANELTYNGCLTKPYTTIENIVHTVMSAYCGKPDCPYTEEEMDKMYKGLILTMHGELDIATHIQLGGLQCKVRGRCACSSPHVAHQLMMGLGV